MANIELIKANLKAKIQKGLYKLVMQESQSPTSEIFKKFAMIATENGRFWEGYASCTNCSEIITQADLYRHQCITTTTRAKEAIQSEDETEDETNIGENKDMQPTSSEPKIWQIFQLNLLEHGDTFKPRLYCRQCCAVLKNEYSTKKQRQTHKCLAVAGER